ncbi:putative malate dehydrogenase [Aspergillus steynii IBT 23096]|uniref:Putative malate dehydrogenase n=1 Tax=Aspergillus steynii IBT 23096 TaxID=1392250 RepID=A0A2I2FWB7_9EURO|nr:putative malate dehydrogenase [Aspergillus steynii IBT 23096]PLB44931.1 putative malate dehydrogenase [Aspergillus steynii IBT 23096]
MASNARYYASPAEATKFATHLLAKSGLSEEDAKSMAECLVLADVRGVDTHGLARLPQYLERVSKGRVNATPRIQITEKTPVVAHLDGDNGFGFVVATKAMTEAIKRAEIYGIGMVTVNHSNHFGMAATYVLQALEANMISLVFTNSAKQMPPFGGKEALLDADGNPTTDVEVALNGSMAPIGGPKGSGIAILMDVMSGVLTGAAFGGEVGDQYKDTKPQNVGHCFVVLRPDVFMSTEDFKARMDVLVQRVHGVSPAPGFSEVLFPGEPEYRLSLQRQKEGIPYADAEKAMFANSAKKYGIDELLLSDTPLSLS